MSNNHLITNIHLSTALRHNSNKDHQQINNYQYQRQKAHFQFYSLYSPQIIRIQRWFRSLLQNRLSKQYIKINKLIRNKLILEQQNKIKHLYLQELKVKKQCLANKKEDVYIKLFNDELIVKIKEAFDKSMKRAEDISQDRANISLMRGQLTQVRHRREQLLGQIEGLRFEARCHKQRKEKWSQTIKVLKEGIMNETLKLMEESNKIKKKYSDKQEFPAYVQLQKFK